MTDEGIHRNGCELHAGSKQLYFSSAMRTICRSSCLGHSRNGCVTYSGIDLKTGQLVYISEWELKNEQLREKCTSSCRREGGKYDGHSVDDVIQCIESDVNRLAQFQHKNLVAYECASWEKTEDGVRVHLVQDFVHGSSVSGSSRTSGWSHADCKVIAKGVIDALTFLNDRNVSHGNLTDRSVFVDSSGACRVTDYALIRYLCYLNGSARLTQDDLPALACLIESMLQSPDPNALDFIGKCKSNRITSVSELRSHRFILSADRTRPSDTQAIMAPPKYVDDMSLTKGKTRLHREFDVEGDVGWGGYGAVWKAKNKLDGRQYAIKRIQLPNRCGKISKHITREVELLSRLNHSNVVRYYNSWIERVNKADMKMNDDEDSDGESDEDDVETEPQPPDVPVMFIQMEFCENNTLRWAIDQDLSSDMDRVWRLFSEILEGLTYIHGQGLIHRDLKPANIFLDSNDQVKIGDFGLATTSLMALKQGQGQGKENASTNSSQENLSRTGEIGSTMYCAPELAGEAWKSTYTQNVDLYSLGVIFFEMCHPPFRTEMERIEVLTALRSPEVTFPSSMLNNCGNEQQIEIINSLLKHDQSERPSAKDLLASDLLPPHHMEDHEWIRALRHMVVNPQSERYKDLVVQCFAQQNNATAQYESHAALTPADSHREMLKKSIVSWFRKHGGIELDIPVLLSSDVLTTRNDVFRLMNEAGHVMALRYDLHLPFVRHVAHKGIESMRRYAIGPVYRSTEMSNSHPKSLYECAFNIVTPSNKKRIHMVDAKLISIAYGLSFITPILNHCNISFRVNHTSMLHAIMLHHNLPVAKYPAIFEVMLDYIEYRTTIFQLRKRIRALLETSDDSAATLISVLLTEFQLRPNGPKYRNVPGIRDLISGQSSISQLARSAMNHIEKMASVAAQKFGVKCPIIFHAGFSNGFDCAERGGIIWQMLGESTSDQSPTTYVLGAGGRYDHMMSQVLQQAPHLKITDISVAGFSFELDKILAILNNGGDVTRTEVILCVTTERRSLNTKITKILRSFWKDGVHCSLVKSYREKEGLELAENIGGIYYVFGGRDGSLRLRTGTLNKFEEQRLKSDELIAHVKRELRPGSSAEQQSTSRRDSVIGSEVRDKIFWYEMPPSTKNLLRSYRMRLFWHIAITSQALSGNRGIFVIAVDLPQQIVSAVMDAISPNAIDPITESDIDISTVIDKYPEHEKCVKDMVAEITAVNSLCWSYGRSPILFLYSMKYSYHCAIS